MKIIIGLAGVKTSGKSTVANIIKEYIPQASESALADKLKNTCAKVFGLKRNFFDLQELKEEPIINGPIELTYGRIYDILADFEVTLTDTLKDNYKDIVGMLLYTPRQIAQIIGTEVLRMTGNADIHCDNVKIDSKITIISDIRFPNEFDYFSKKKGLSLYLYIYTVMLQKRQ